MKVIAFTNRKGGVGKTTHSVHTAAGLAQLGLRVGLVDTDSQGHAGLMLGMPEYDGLYDLLIGLAGTGKSAMKLADESAQGNVFFVPPERYSPASNTSPGELYLIPSSQKTYMISHQLEESDGFAFYETMELFTDMLELDVIVVDTNPSMTKLDGAIWLGTDGFISVTELNRLSIDGVERAMGQLQNFAKVRRKYLQRNTQIVGVLPNKTRALPRLHQHNKGVLRDAFGDLVWDPIPQSVAWEESTNDYDNPQTLYTYKPGSAEAKRAMAVAIKTWEIVSTW